MINTDTLLMVKQKKKTGTGGGTIYLPQIHKKNDQTHLEKGGIQGRSFQVGNNQHQHPARTR